jgi:hypothetical protein
MQGTNVLHALQALQALCDEPEAISGLALPAHWARDFWLAAVCLELQHNAEALSRLQALNQVGHTAQQGRGHSNRSFTHPQTRVNPLPGAVLCTSITPVCQLNAWCPAWPGPADIHRQPLGQQCRGTGALQHAQL